MSILKRKSKKAEETSADVAVEAAAAPVEKKAKAPKKAKVEKTEKKEKSKTVSRFAAETIIAPLVTEKAARLSSGNVMVFRVATSATRIAVKQAVKELYGVTPVKVNIINVRGTMVRFGRFSGMRKDMKKALVTLPAGAHIDVFAS